MLEALAPPSACGWKLFPAAICTVLLAVTAFAQNVLPTSTTSADAARVVGTWQGRTPDGMGATLSLRGDYNLTFSPCMTIDLALQAHGDELVGNIASADARSEVVRIRAAGDRLVYTAVHAPAEHWIRLGKPVPGQPPYAGKWAIDPFAPVPADTKKKKQKNQNDASQLDAEARKRMRLMITPQGTARLLLPLRTDIGAYNVQGHQLIMQYGGKVWAAAFRFEGETLYLRFSGDDEESVFERGQ